MTETKKSPRYVNAVDTAKMIRKVLKKKFDGTKFSVRTSKYSGGASIRIRWTDGPTAAEVDKVVGPYSGSGFDGMIDMQYSKTAYLLADGFTAVYGNSRGTGMSRGSVPASEYDGAGVGMEEVNFLADYVFTERTHSKELMEKVADVISEDEGIDRSEFEVKGSDEYGYRLERAGDKWGNFTQEGRRIASQIGQ